MVNLRICQKKKTFLHQLSLPQEFCQLGYKTEIARVYSGTIAPTLYIGYFVHILLHIALVIWLSRLSHPCIDYRGCFNNMSCPGHTAEMSTFISRLPRTIGMQTHIRKLTDRALIKVICLCFLHLWQCYTVMACYTIHWQSTIWETDSLYYISLGSD